MVATTDCIEESKPIVGKKVSKPIMEKKRRARINKSLDQLKSLLENYYSTSIRKRKLEKADILELTVNHLRNLQKIQSCTASASEFPDFQSGFRRCLTNVNQYLLMADNLSGSERWMLSQLSRKVGRSRGGEEAFSTTDSYTGRAETPDEARRLLPAAAAGTEERHTTKAQTLKSNHTKESPSSRSEPPRKNKRVAVVAAHTQRLCQKSSSHKELDSVGHSNEGANTAAQNVWRPW